MVTTFQVWDAMYGVIENANLVVDGINNSQLIQQAGATRTSMMRFRAEAMTLRAMIYFDLIRLFGDIPFKQNLPTATCLMFTLERQTVTISWMN